VIATQSGSTPEVRNLPRPEYPRQAQLQGIQGEVLLDVLFTATGRIRVLRIVRRIGHGLEEAARDAVERIEFKPALENGMPVDFRTTVTVVFLLT
jgi:protein TonB